MARRDGEAVIDTRSLQVIAPNFKRRLSGVTSTIVQLVPAQRAAGLDIAVFGPGLPTSLPRLRWRQLPSLWRRPAAHRHRVWHARRNTEMIGGIVLRDFLRMPLKLVFTSAAQRRHKPLTKWLISRMDAVIATSARSGAFLDVPHRVIPHGIDTARFRPPDDKRAAKAALGLDPDGLHVGCSGRIRPNKGTDLFVDAMIAALPRNPGWSAAITGRATTEHEAFKRQLEERIAAAGLTKRIVFTGEVPDIVPWFQAFDLFVAPSREEGFGLTPLEAMACGVPAIASKAGAYETMIDDGETGLILPDFEAASLCTAFERMAADTVRRQETAARALADTRSRFRLDGEVRSLAEVYDSVAPRLGDDAVD
ncbi:glycosyltransferase family 4 protein [Oricola sp.]|uniref:glycosyltransferase family 4 protein n=1 Tax=Oricola sp. TaxID=1979950 RepID=UPI003BAAA356